YAPRPYAGPVTLYRASHVDASFEHAGPALGWEGLVEGMAIVEVPGDHDSLVLEPNVSAVTAHLRDTLRRALHSSAGAAATLATERATASRSTGLTRWSAKPARRDRS